MDRKVKAVIFDLDDTLIRSNVDFMEMRSRMIDFLKRYLPFPVDLNTNKSTHEITECAVRLLKEHGKSEMIPRVIGELNSIMTDVELKHVSKARLIDGVIQSLNRLRRAGIRIGVLTRSCRKYTDQTLKATGLSTFVDEVATRDDSNTPKPDPSQVHTLLKRMHVGPDQVVMVGDHPIDALCAKNAGVSFVGVLTGRLRSEQPKQFAEKVLPSVKELPDLFGM
jgi:phosphoglycolate phosphatase